MPRSSKHKPRRGHKRGGGARSDSEESSPAARASRDPARRSAGSDKKRKERASEASPPDRWSGGEGDDPAAEKRAKSEEFGPLDVEKSARSKLSSWKREASAEKNEEVKQRAEKDSGRRESKEVKERERDGRRERLKRDEEERKEGESAERRIQELLNSEIEKELEKHTRKRGECSADKDKWLADAKDSDDRRLSSRDDRTKSGYYNDETHKERIYTDKYRENLDKDHRNQGERSCRDGPDQRHQHERSSRDDRDQRHRHERSSRDDLVERHQDEHPSRDDRDQRHQDERISRDDRDQRHRDERISRDDRDQRHRDEHISRDDRDQRHRDERICRDDRDRRHRDERSLRDERDQRYRDDHTSRGERGQGHRDDHTPRNDQDQRRRDEKHYDDGSSRDRTSDRSDSKHFREEKNPSEIYKKGKYHDSDHDDGPYVDDHVTKYKDSRERKRSSDVNEDRCDLKPRSAKEPREDVDRTASAVSKFENHAVRPRLDYRYSDKDDPSLSNSQRRISPSSSSHAKDQSRISSRQAESTHRGSSSDERLRISTPSTGEHVRTARVLWRASETQSLVKTKATENIYSCELDSHNSDQMAEKSSSMNHRRLSDTTVARHSLDIEEVGRQSSFKDVVDCSITKESPEKTIVDDGPQAELLNSEDVPLVSSSFKRMASHFASNSPSRLPSPHVRLGTSSPSVLGSYEDDMRGQSGDRRSNGRYKRNDNFIMGRGQGNVWKGTPTWPSPVANGFIPFQHGHTGFHPNVQQFSAPPLFGVRPSMNLNHTGVPYHLHASADRFSVHGRPFGWRSPVDDSCPPHLQPWDGSNGMFGDESHVYARAEWDHSKPLMGSRGWEMKPEIWRGQDGNVNSELSDSQKEPEYSVHAPVDDAWVGQSGHRLRNERARSESLHAESSGVKWLNDMSPAKTIEPLPKQSLHENRPDSTKTPSVLEPSRALIDDDPLFVCTYLSKLDISLDLSHPELYKQCMFLLEKRDVSDVHNVSKQEQPRENKEEVEVATKSANYIKNFLFPITSDAIFQRAISLYKQSSEGIKVKAPTALTVGAREGSSPQAYDEKVKAMDNHFNSGDASLSNANPSIEEGSNAFVDVEVGFPDDSKDQNSGLVIDAVVFVDGSHSPSCDALIPECRVNLSRRPNSPESTH